jgi:hypothetical protein
MLLLTRVIAWGTGRRQRGWCWSRACGGACSCRHPNRRNAGAARAGVRPICSLDRRETGRIERAVRRLQITPVGGTVGADVQSWAGRGTRRRHLVRSVPMSHDSRVHPMDTTKGVRAKVGGWVGKRVGHTHCPGAPYCAVDWSQVRDTKQA